MEKIKWVLGAVGVSVLVVVIMVMGMSRLGDVGVKEYGEEELIAGARWVKNNGSTKVTVVEFSDIQCPACQIAEKEAKKIRDMDGVRFVYRHFPLPNIHKNAVNAAIATEVARDMGKGWEMLERLFEKQGEWSNLDADSVRRYFVAVAKDMSLDEKVYEQKYIDGFFRRLVDDESLVPLKLQLSGTPTFFVDGVKTDLSQLEKVVKTALGK